LAQPLEGPTHSSVATTNHTAIRDERFMAELTGRMPRHRLKPITFSLLLYNKTGDSIQSRPF
jgi:hypothetical protein